MVELKKSNFDGIYFIDNKLAVLNLVSGYNPFNDQIFKIDGKEYIEWNPNRSKLAATIIKKIEEVPIEKNNKLVYLGCAHGYTCSKIASIIGKNGIIYAIEFSERCFNELLPICQKYRNIVPILADARKTELYNWIEKVDVVYCDIAQPDETEIAIRNCREFLRAGGHLLIAIKSRSIDVIKSPKKVYHEEIEKLKKAGFEIIDWKVLDPFERAHAMILAKMK